MSFMNYALYDFLLQKNLINFNFRDASWESDPNAFAELAVRPNRCEAEDCKCDKGREFEENSGDWDFMICLGCGSKAKHQACLEIVRMMTFTTFVLIVLAKFLKALLS